MEYIKAADYDYIMNKYHDSAKPFDPYNWFIRHDAVFSPGTGLDAEAIKEEILRRDEKISGLHHSIRKARAMECVLENTRISCDCRDRFPALNMLDRPLNATVIGMWRDEVFGEIIPETEEKRAYFENEGIVAIWPDYCHSVPMWERILDLGFVGLLKESEAARSARKLSQNEDAFFEGIKITYTAIMNLTGRLSTLAYETEGSERMAKALENIRSNPPATF